jgi:hypothetical protein
MGERRKRDRSTELDLFDSLRTRGVLCLEFVVGVRVVPGQRLRSHSGRQILVDLDSSGSRCGFTAPLHLGRRKVRGTQLDHHQRHIAVNSHDLHGDHPEARCVAEHDADRRRASRCWWGKLLVVDGEH